MNDTPEAQAARVAGIRVAGHVPVVKHELGYATERCAECGTSWPCPDMAQAREWRTS